MSKLSDLLIDENISRCVDEVVQAFETKATKENLEMDFHINQGKMAGGLGESNTTFKFDTDKGQFLTEVRLALTEAFRSDVDDAEASEEAKLINAFQDKIAVALGSKEYNKRLGDILRSNSAGLGAPEWLIPIPEIRFHSFDISSDDEGGYMLRVQKGVDKGQQSVAPELIKIHQETGKPFEQIIAEKKAEKDSRYESVESAEWKRYIFHVHIHFAADYSPCENNKDVESRIQGIMSGN